ncbi:MAG: hypothetical protein V4549_04155 [Bacteroidota bacterium]|jgi:hypothetical protein|nr:hypothetical protein [Bacteroidia bacterium]
MMTNYLKNNPAIDAVIYLKNGTRKHGVLVDNSLRRNDAFHFICNTNFHLFQETNSPEFIEIVPGKLIASIDTNLK